MKKSWTEFYWNALKQIYWVSSYVGMKSIPRGKWSIEGDKICVPKELVSMDGPLYTRQRKIDDYFIYMRRQEETLNHLFNFVFGILPSEIICKLFGNAFDFERKEHFLSLNDDMAERYSWGKFENRTQVDGFFVSKNTILAVELKFNAKTSRDQLAKYISLMISEQDFSKNKKNLYLLYILNKDEQILEKQLGFDYRDLSSQKADIFIDSVKNSYINNHLRNNYGPFKDVLERIEIRGITWEKFSNDIESYMNGLSDNVGDKTIYNLLNGLNYEIKKHPLSNMKPN